MSSRAAKQQTMPRSLTVLLAGACAMIVANVYYAQPLIGPISTSLGMPAHAAGLIVTLTQIGYGIGLLLIVPVGDLIENRRLILCTIGFGVVALLAAALAERPASFLAASLCIGLGSVAVQILVPYAAHLAPPEQRGRVVGNVTSGLMLGIMLARPAASFITAALSWHAVFFMSAALLVALCVVLRLALPPRHPEHGLRYPDLLLSMAGLVRRTALLRRLAIYHACLFGAFSLFWTTVPLLLAGTYGFSQNGIALFAAAGVAGVVAAPIAGRLGDRGWSRIGTGVAIGAVAVSLLVALERNPISLAHSLQR